MMTHGTGRDALDEFLPETTSTADVVRHRGEQCGEIDLFISPQEVQVDPLDAIARSAAPANSSSVQLWPMLAAALVAIGVTMLAMAALATFGSSAL